MDFFLSSVPELLEFLVHSPRVTLIPCDLHVFSASLGLLLTALVEAFEGQETFDFIRVQRLCFLACV